VIDALELFGQVLYVLRLPGGLFLVFLLGMRQPELQVRHLPVQLAYLLAP
jgi:hypothetical protein